MKFRDLVGLLCLIIVLIVLWQFRQILLLILTAMVLAIAMNNFVRIIIRKFKMRRGWAVSIALSQVTLAIAVLLLLVIPLVVNQSQQIIQIIPIGFQNLSSWINNFLDNPPPWIPESALNLPPFSELMQQISALIRNVFGSFYNFFSSSLTVLLELLLIIVLSLMFLADPLAYRRLILSLFPPSYQKRADEIFSKCETGLLNWLGGVVLQSLFVAILSFLGLSLLRVDYAFTHAFVAGLFNFVPNVGPLLSTVFPLSVALLDSWDKSLAVIVLYVIIQNVESYWFGPAIVKQKVSLLPAATLISQIFFAMFLGPLGLLLAIPLAVIAKTWIEEAWLKDVLGYRDTSRAERSSLQSQ